MKPVLLVSLDFELFWGMQDGHTLDSYIDNILGGREAVPRLLSLFSQYGIHATWATVGMMFAQGEDEIKEYLPQKDQWPSYDNKALLPYDLIEEQGRGESELPWLYAPSLIQRISETEGMEIGTHTFSHYYCREAGQTIEQFTVDIKCARKIAEDKGYLIRSVVLPRNQCETAYTKVLAEQGFTAYRDEENDWIHERIRFRPLLRLLRLIDVYFPITGQGGYIPKKEEGIWNFTGSRMYKPYFKPLAFLERVKIYRIKKQMLHAAKNGLVFHLWWHPHNIGVRTDFHLKQLEEIFSYYETLNQKYGMQSMNMGEAAAYFDTLNME